jgi:Carboxypeptidase regulatory-like domain
MTRCASKRVLRPFNLIRTFLGLVVLMALAAHAVAQVDAPPAQSGSISGTVMDADGDIIPGASVTLAGPAGPGRTLVADSNGAFDFSNLPPGGPYSVTIGGDGLLTWKSSPITLEPGQVVFVSGIKVELSGGATSVTVSASSEPLAVQQVNAETKQRVLGIVPNFYVVYNHNPVPLTPRLKFALAWRAESDPVTFVGVAALSAMDQAGDTPDYDQGARGFGERVGANYTMGFTDIMVGGAILPSLLRQDPRYFYQGTGTTRSRVFHALSAPFIARGDNGRWQPNFSSVGGDLAAGAIAEAYYPATNRGAGMLFQNVLITTGGRMATGIVQEFVLHRLTPSVKNQRD